MLDDSTDFLPFLNSASTDFKQQFVAKSIAAKVPEGEFICLERNQCMHLPIVVSGIARVYKASDEGRELTLYRIVAGESCILTASCIMNQIVFPANAVASSDIEAILIPSHDVKDWMQRFPDWQQYIFNLLSQRFAGVIELIEEVAFHKMDNRLASYLFEASAHTVSINQTHEAIATDLGTSREVVSRLLKEFEHRGILSLSRGMVQVLERDALLHIK